MIRSEDRAGLRRRALLGAALVGPSAAFITAALLKYGLGVSLFFEPIERLSRNPAAWRVFNLVSPVVFLVGSLLAVVLNGLVVAGFQLRRVEQTLTTTVTLRLRPGLATTG